MQLLWSSFKGRHINMHAHTNMYTDFPDKSDAKNQACAFVAGTPGLRETIQYKRWVQYMPIYKTLKYSLDSKHHR